MRRPALLAFFALAACGWWPDFSPSSGNVSGTLAGTAYDCPIDVAGTEFHSDPSGGYALNLSACDGRLRATGHLTALEFLLQNHDGLHRLPRCVVAGREQTQAPEPAADAGVAGPDAGSDAGAVASASVVLICGPTASGSMVDRFGVLDPSDAPALDFGELDLTDSSHGRLKVALLLRFADGSELRSTVDLRRATELEPRSSGGGGSDWDD